MELFKIIILGIIQGITEFLPISSSGHLVLFQHILDIKEGLTLDVFLHFGTLLAVVIVYWQDIVNIITFKPQYRKFSVYILLGSVPAGVIGILFEDLFEQLFSTLIVVGFMLLITGLLLWLSDRIEGNARGLEELGFKDAMVVGFAQAAAIFPGISRSGSTIVAGLFNGLDRKIAAKYSFLLSIPVIGGATLLKVKDIIELGIGNTNILQLIVGTVASMISGYFSIKLLLKLINQERLSFFAYYCWGLGLLIILFA